MQCWWILSFYIMLLSGQDYPHLTCLEAYTLDTEHYILDTAHYTLHTTHYIHRSKFILHTSYYVLHTTKYIMKTTNYRLHTWLDQNSSLPDAIMSKWHFSTQHLSRWYLYISVLYPLLLTRFLPNFWTQFFLTQKFFFTKICCIQTFLEPRFFGPTFFLAAK